MNIRLIIPTTAGQTTGNRHTAENWQQIFTTLGHTASVHENCNGEPCDLMVALNGVKTRAAIRLHFEKFPAAKRVVALTGTDLNISAPEELEPSLQMADQLVVLHEKALEQVPEQYRHKTRVIFQSAAFKETLSVRKHEDTAFDLCVIGHLREVKDPMRAARASRLLPPESKLRIRHAGSILDESFRAEVEEEMQQNPRYQWLGVLDADEVQRLLLQSRAMVLSSKSEGGPDVIGKAVISGCAILATRIDGVTGLIGDDYAGLFEVGDTKNLAVLMRKLETDNGFTEKLKRQIHAAAPRFDPEHEQSAWQQVLEYLSEAHS